MKKCNPLLKLRRANTWKSLRELIRDSGSSRAPKFCCPPNTRETKRESCEARSGYRITCPRGIWGWPAYKDRDRTRAIERWGIPQDVDAEGERTSISRIPLNSNINSLSLSISRSTLSLWDLFLPVLEQIFIYDQISQISFFLYNARLFEYFFFSLRILIIYIEIRHISFGFCLCTNWRKQPKTKLNKANAFLDYIDGQLLPFPSLSAVFFCTSKVN
jgi:hypothetical protein